MSEDNTHSRAHNTVRPYRHTPWEKVTELSPEIIEAGWAESIRIDDLDEGMYAAVMRVDAASDKTISISGPPTYSLSVCFGGSSLITLNDGPPMEMKAGMAAIFTSITETSGSYSVRRDKPYEIVDIRYQPEAVQSLGGETMRRFGRQLLIDRSDRNEGTIFAGFDAPADLLRTARDIAACDYPEGPIRKIYLKGLAYQCLAIAFSHLASDGNSEIRLSPADRRKITTAANILQSHFQEDWTIPKLARAVGVSEKKLKLGFRSQVGRTIHTHLRKIRLETAMSMLEDGYAVTETAYACGFNNLSHFSKVFRTSYGVLPRDFSRRNLLKQER